MNWQLTTPDGPIGRPALRATVREWFKDNSEAYPETQFRIVSEWRDELVYRRDERLGILCVMGQPTREQGLIAWREGVAWMKLV